MMRAITTRTITTRAITLGGLLAAITLCFGCSSPTEMQADPITLTFSPQSGPIGTVVSLSGLGVDDSEVSRYSVEFSAMLSPLRLSGSALQTIVPLGLATPADAPKAGPTELEIVVFRDGKEFVRAASTFQLEESPLAPGAADSLLANLRTVVKNLRSFSRLQPDIPSIQTGGLTSWYGALDSLLAGDGEYSLQTQLNQVAADSPDFLASFESLIKVSGLGQQSQALAEFSRALAAQAAAANASRKSSDLLDYDLAGRMQLHALLKDFGSQVISQTNQDWSNTVGLVAGTAGLVVAVPLAGQISAILAVADFILNKVALGYLPARIQSLELEVVDLLVPPGEVPETKVRLVAVNDPPAITFQDFISLVLLGMSQGGARPDSFRDFLVATANWYLGLVRTLMGAYDNLHPEIAMDIDVASIPIMRWETTITTKRYLVLNSLTPEIINPVDQDIVAWRATTDGQGEGRIYARTSSGPEVTNLPLIGGIEYHGGSFGIDIVSTATKSVYVANGIFVTTTMNPDIAPGGINGLEVRVGTVGPTGDTVWLNDILVECSATGGAVSPATGLTGADGRFDTFVSLNSGSSSVSIDVVATGDFDQSASTTVIANCTAAQCAAQFVQIVGLPDRLAAGQSVPITIRAGTNTTTGPEYAAGVDITLQIRNGQTTALTGQTDASGEFSTTLTMYPENVQIGYFNNITVSAQANFVGGATASAEDSALKPNAVVADIRTAIMKAEVAFQSRNQSVNDYAYFADGELGPRFDLAAIDTTISLSESGATNGMSGSGSIKLTMNTSMIGATQTFAGAHFKSTTEGETTLSNPNFDIEHYGIRISAESQVRYSFSVYGDPTTFTISGTKNAQPYSQVELWGPQDRLFGCDSETPCAGFQGSGTLQPGNYQFIVRFRTWEGFQWCDGCDNNGATNGTVRGDSDLDVTLSVGSK